MIKTKDTKSKSNTAKKQSYTYIGVDLSAKYLDVWVEDGYIRYSNDEKGLSQLRKRIEQIDGEVIVVCEATGSISLYFCKELDNMGIKHKVLTPSWVRHFAKSKGQVAKTDKIDSKIIWEYAQTYRVHAEMPLTEDELRLRLLTGARALLIKQQGQIKTTLRNYRDETIREILLSTIETLEEKIEKLGQQIKEIIFADKEKKALYELLVRIPGIAEKVAAILICRLPELGSLTRKQVAAAIGVSPYNWDSGGHIGKRIPRFGRSVVRHMLYMSIVGDKAAKDSMVKKRYDALRAKGKPYNVAMVACIRWKICKINAIIKAWIAQGRPENMPLILH